MLLDHADFALQEQAEDNLMVAFTLAWYNDSNYTTAAKPIKSLELHYTMIQFLINRDIFAGFTTCGENRTLQVSFVSKKKICGSHAFF